MYEERRARVWRSQIGAGGEGTFIVQVGVLAFSSLSAFQIETNLNWEKGLPQARARRRCSWC